MLKLSKLARLRRGWWKRGACLQIAQLRSPDPDSSVPPPPSSSRKKTGPHRPSSPNPPPHTAAPWLEVPDVCAEADDELDALVASLVTRAAVLGRTHPVPPGEREAALREGWIAVPRPGTLERLPYPS